MEKFKATEKEIKQKPHSKDSLGGSSGTGSRYDPQAKECEELKEWLNTSISTLNSQLEDYESKLEDLNANKKKKIDKEVNINRN